MPEPKPFAEALALPLTGQQKARKAAAYFPTQCLCGRFARLISYQANTMPDGESVTTVHCARCGEVQIR